MALRPRRALLLLAGLLSLLVAPRAGAVLLFDGGAPEGGGNAIEVTIRVLANDFELTERSTVMSVEVWALTDASWDGTVEYFFFENAGNVPAAVPFASGDGTNIVPTPTGVTSGALTEYLYAFDLAAPLVLEAGQKYWFGLHLKQSFADDGNNAFWSITSLDFGETSRSAEGGNFAAWTIPPDDEAFRLYGEVPEPAAALQALAGALVLVACRGARTQAP
jgi:hypothetical protein